MANRTLATAYRWIRGNDCVYCGEPAEVRDHALPVAYTRAVSPAEAERAMMVTVPACFSCNAILGARVFDSLSARAQYVGEYLARKHRRLLDGPVWSADEIANLGPTLRGGVVARQDKRKAVAARIAQIAILAENVDSLVLGHETP